MIIVVLLVWVLAAAITALILVLVLKGGSGGGGSNIPKGINVYTVANTEDGMWYYNAVLKKTKNATFPVPVDETNQLCKDLNYRVSII